MLPWTDQIIFMGGGYFPPRVRFFKYAKYQIIWTWKIINIQKMLQKFLVLATEPSPPPKKKP